MNEPLKVLIVSQEITPYLPESEISTLSRNLPQAIQEKGKEIRTFMPRYGCVNERRNQLHEVIRLSGMNIIINDTDHPLIIKVASIQSIRMQVYFIDNEEFFRRKAITKDASGKDFDDNDERAIFFARGVIETVKKLRWAPDIVHCHGWMTAFMPLYIKKVYNEDPFFKNSKVIYSVYDDEFKNTFKSNISDKIIFDNLSLNDLSVINGKVVDFTALSKLAIEYSDGVIQGSENINNYVSKFVADKNIPFLPYQNAETYADAYDDFYNKIAK